MRAASKLYSASLPTAVVPIPHQPRPTRGQHVGSRTVNSVSHSLPPVFDITQLLVLHRKPHLALPASSHLPITALVASPARSARICALCTTTATMSKMPATHAHSEACCNVPPVVATGYKAKGAYETLGGMKTYATGPDDATKGIVYIMDIFGYKDQTLQGADILAAADTHQKYKVVMPDWFGDEPAPLEIFPPDTPDKQAKLMAFLTKNAPAGPAGVLPGYAKAAQEKYPSVEKWAVIGFCWGGKVVSLVTSGDQNPFAVAAECHPAMVDPKDAVGIKIPITMLASMDEPVPDVEAFEKNLTVPHHVEIFADQVHGWMAARADLADEHIKAEYTRGYKTVAEFFGKHL